MEEQYVMICPKCSGVNVHSDLSKEMLAWGGSTRYVCDDCGHSAVAFPEIEKSSLKNAKKKVTVKTKKQEKIMKDAVTTKGVTNKTLNLIMLSIYAFSFIVLVTSFIWWGIMNGSFIVSFISGLLLILLISSFFYITKKV